jgi:uncharacterized damage-inducible protein DinB
MDGLSLRRMFDYHYWANSLVWDCVTKLTDEQFTRHLDYSVGSIQRHVQHSLLVEWMWFSVARGTLPDDRSQWLASRALTTREALLSQWQQLEAEVHAYLNGVTDEQLNQPLEYEFSWCGAQVNYTWEPLLYIVTHMIDHRAQILQGIHHMGGETVEQDFIQFVWKHPARNPS